MEGILIFGIMMLGVCGIGLQHLSNWLFRESSKPDNDGLIIFALIAQIASLGMFYIMVTKAVEIF